MHKYPHGDIKIREEKLAKHTSDTTYGHRER